MYAVIMTDGDYTSKPSVIATGGSEEDAIENGAQAAGDDEASIVMMRDELSLCGIFDTGHCAYHVVKIA